jgi:acetyl-CoA synthetase
MDIEEEISKLSVDELSVRPNLDNYQEMTATFEWEDIYGELDWLPNGGLNKAYECIDRHAAGLKRDKPALIWEGTNGEQETYTFEELRNE